VVKRAFSLIELIFAIVIVSIALLALPPLFSVASSSTKVALHEEAVFQGFQTAGVLLTYPWDDKSISPKHLRSFILDTQGDSELNRSSVDPLYRVGNLHLGRKRRFYDAATPASYPLGPESAETQKDDVDDFDGSSEIISSNLLDLNITTRVTYTSDSADYSLQNIAFTFGATTPSTSNIKQILITAKDSDGNTIITYATFVANTGSPVIKRRELK
jgi:prepilin-type N-terminal cleavage/methylation domain-containing protein